MKKLAMISTLMLSVMSGSVLADNHTLSAGYAQSKVQDFKNIKGMNLQYRYEWDSSVSVVGSFSYMKGDWSDSYHDEGGDFYRQQADIKYYSFLAGPAYRLNDYISFYGLAGISHTKVKGDYEWRNSVGVDEPDGHLSGYVSKKSTDFAYAAGVMINPVDNMSVNVGYEGSKADFYGKHSVNGFTVGVGYRF
ncbi:Ail/Lom family outer membrane beta-barrel protein [Escherichia coli]|uniref:Ail/Lom family outer membrane beta-barrel protein n=1 Tax=Escherichia coli TaxID=562 RepID=UPI0013E0B986|nr:Ail/Lom family outer membrane beta-barrel protein [Escherichia coli]